jgi:hypothetical protein
MAFKARFMWVLDVSSIERLCMVMSHLSNLSIRKLEFYLHSVVDHGRRVQSLVKEVPTRRNLASMWIPLYLFSV